MNLIRNLLDQLAARRKTSREIYLELLQRADAPQAGDVEKLNEVMKDLNISAEDAHADADAVQRVKGLEATRPDVEALSQQIATARQAVKSHDSETEEITRRRSAEREALQLAHDKAAAKMGLWGSSQQEIEKIKFAKRSRQLFPN